MGNLVGQVIGNYRIEALLGSGGMGEVYRGTHVHLQRPGAIKVMHEALASEPTFQARFRREAQAAAALSHPHIVEVFDFGEQDGRAYLVMELVPDGSLRSLLQQGAAGQGWSLTTGVDLVRQAAEGLAYAHAQGMVHRDIKPDNLLLHGAGAASPAGYILKISDFGLARLAESSGLTASGAVMGTPNYMSPEQCQGAALDGRSDIYSLGVVLYEVATGYVPFQAKTLTEAAYKHVHTAPRPPRQLQASLPDALETIILRCLAKQPDQRYANASELATALAAVLADPQLKTVAAIVPPPQPSGVRVRRATARPAPTARQDAVAGGTTAVPATPPLPPGATLPRVCVLDRDGALVQVVDLTTSGLTLGREAGNTILLDHAAISRHHLRINWDGKQASITDLGSSNGTRLGGGRLLANANQPWAAADAVRIGPYWLKLVPPTAARPSPIGATLRADDAVSTQPQTTAPIPTALDSGSGTDRLTLQVEPPALTLTPGQPSAVRVTLANQGSTVDHLALSVEGLPGDWVQVPPQPIQLNPGIKQTVALTVSVARLAANQAGEYTPRIVARSQEFPGDWQASSACWTVLPFAATTLKLRPVGASGRGSASYTLGVRNEGNALAAFALAGEDDEARLAYAFEPASVSVPPGREAEVRLRVSTRQRLLGRPEPPYPFTVHAEPATAPSSSAVQSGTPVTPLTTLGRFTNLPLLPAWVIPAAAAVLVAALAVAAIFLIPHGSTPSAAGLQSTAAAQAQSATLTAAANAAANAKNGATATAAAGAQATAQANATATASSQQTAVANAPVQIPSLSSTTLAQGLAGAVGSAYIASQDRLVFVQYGGTLAAISNVSTAPSYQVLGTGYSQPEGIAVSSDGQTAYITERTGDLVRVSLNNANRAAAAGIVNDLHSPQQVTMDSSGNLYVVEFATPARLVRIDPNTGMETTVVSNLANAIGVVVTSDAKLAYVTQQLPNAKGEVTRVDMTNGSEVSLVTSTTAPLFDLAWASPAQNGIFVTERDPANKVWLLDLTTQPTTLRLVASAAARPSSVAVVAQQGAAFPIVVCSAGEVDELKPQ